MNILDTTLPFWIRSYDNNYTDVNYVVNDFLMISLPTNSSSAQGVVPICIIL